MPPSPMSRARRDRSSAVSQPPRRRRARRSWAQRLVLGTGIVVVGAILATIAVVGYGWWQFNKINKEKLALAPAVSSEPQNILIVGSDSRAVIAKNDPNYSVFNGGGDPTGGQRSDTIMVVRVDPKANTVDMVSFPRDLWVPIARTGASQRINTAYSAADGHQRLIDTIQQDFGIPINHYVDVNFASFRDVVGALGGISLYFDKPMRDTNSGLDIRSPGCVQLDGAGALAFARSRHLQYYSQGRWHDDPTADLGRISRQQYFVRKVIDKATSKAVSLDLLGTRNLLQAGVKNLTIDTAFSFDTMLSLARQFRSFSGGQMVSHTLPVTPWTTDGGAAVLQLDQSGAQPILDLFKGKAAASKVKPSDVTLSVRNGNGVAGAAGRVELQLRGLGFVVSGVDSGQTIARTQVQYATGAQDRANLVALHMKGGAETVEDPTLAANTVRLILGQDFTGVVDASGAPVGTSGSSPTVSQGTATTSAPTTTTSSVIGVVPGQPPPGVPCG